MVCFVQSDSKLIFKLSNKVYPLGVLLDHLKDSLLGLLGAGRTQIVAGTINKGECSLGARGEELDMLNRDILAEHRVLGALSLCQYDASYDMSDE